MFTKYLTLLSLTAFATAQSSSTIAAGAVPSAPADTTGRINVDVGFQGGLTYHPSNIIAPVGTLVTFYFPKSVAHSVTQSTFENPCTYLAASSNSPAGFDSALQTAATFTINVTDTESIWFFCRQASHCGRGMVGSINAAASGNTFQAFQGAARAVGSSAPTQTAASPVTGGVHGIATAVPSSDVGSSGSSGSGGTSTVAVSTGLLLISAMFGILML